MRLRLSCMRSTETLASQRCCPLCILWHSGRKIRRRVSLSLSYIRSSQCNHLTYYLWPGHSYEAKQKITIDKMSYRFSLFHLLFFAE